MGRREVISSINLFLPAFPPVEGGGGTGACGEEPLYCTLWVPSHFSFISQLGPPLSGISGQIFHPVQSPWNWPYVVQGRNDSYHSEKLENPDLENETRVLPMCLRLNILEYCRKDPGFFLSSLFVFLPFLPFRQLWQRDWLPPFPHSQSFYSLFSRYMVHTCGSWGRGVRVDLTPLIRRQKSCIIFFICSMGAQNQTQDNALNKVSVRKFFFIKYIFILLSARLFQKEIFPFEKLRRHSLRQKA